MATAGQLEMIFIHYTGSVRDDVSVLSVKHLTTDKLFPLFGNWSSYGENKEVYLTVEVSSQT